MSSNADAADTCGAAPEYEKNVDFSAFKTDVKPIALYPPQFHASQEGNALENADDGADALKKQAVFAKSHGIYGFGFYYLSFSEAKGIENPAELLLENGDIDIPFFLMYDNGYSAQSTSVGHKAFIRGLKEYTDDNRYIRVSGKPVIGLCRSEEFSVIQETLCQWRQAARETGIGELYILLLSSDSAAAESELEGLIDGACAFPFGRKEAASQKQLKCDEASWSFKCLVEKERTVLPTSERHDCFRGVLMNWNPSAPQAEAHCFTGFSFPVLDLWLKEEIVYSRKYLSEDRRFLFFNAQSRWGEGSYLEPDPQYGYTAINTLSRAIYGFPCGGAVTPELMILGAGVPADRAAVWSERLRKKPLVAVQAHVFYDDLIDEITQYTNNIPVPFDLYVSTDNQEKAEKIREYLSRFSNAVNCVVDVLGNQGRDVIPFLKQMEGRVEKYDYLCHIHTKRSAHDVILGEVWRSYLYENLLGSREIVSEILNLFETNGQLGIVMPENMDFVQNFIEWGSNQDIARTLMQRIHCEIELPDDPIMFPAGDMFWMRTKAVSNLFDTSRFEDLVPEEAGQIDGTLMHAVERSWLYVAESNGYSYAITRSITDNRPLVHYADTGWTRRVADRAECSRSMLRMIQMIAAEIGVMRSAAALLWAIWFFIRKRISFLTGNYQNDPYPYAVKNVAHMLGIKNAVTLVGIAFEQKTWKLKEMFIKL